MKNTIKFLLIAALFSSLGTLTGCASTAAGITKGVLDKVFEPDPSSIEADLQATLEVNPDADERPSPLVIRFYELKSLSVFNSKDFFELFEHDVALLSDELLVRDELIFQPGEVKRISRELQPDTRFIGVIGAFRDIENATWRKTIEIELNDKTTFVVEFQKTSVEIRKTSR